MENYHPYEMAMFYGKGEQASPGKLNFNPARVHFKSDF